MSSRNKKREEASEPWGPQAIFVDRLLSIDENDVYIAPWTSKQIKWLAMVVSLIETTEQYINIKLPWLRDLVNEYMRLSKFEKGWIIKQAKDVARGGVSRMLFNIARWKKIWYSDEGLEE